jgi:hypothetical protein
MIIYSAMPLELILEGIEEERQPYHEMQVNGMVMQVEPINSYEARIVRLISPNPQDYLNPAYAPGQIVRFAPSI